MLLAVHCGLRQGELLGLKWDDVDLKGGTLQVRRTLTGSWRPPRLHGSEDRQEPEREAYTDDRRGAQKALGAPARRDR